jgi:hypothetical protein
LKAVNLSVVALIAALSGLATGIASKDSGMLATSILALVTAFLPAVQLVLPWFSPPDVKGEMPKLHD